MKFLKELDEPRESIAQMISTNFKDSKSMSGPQVDIQRRIHCRVQEDGLYIRMWLGVTARSRDQGKHENHCSSPLVPTLEAIIVEYQAFIFKDLLKCQISASARL